MSSLPSEPAHRPSSAASSPPTLWIGDWRVDREANALLRGSESVRIEPKAMDVLALLAQRAGRVVSREELLEAVWPGVVVGDEALTQSVIKLRRALGDQPRAPSYIETIAKRGYRLIAAVREREAMVEPTAEATPPAGAPIRRHARWPAWLTVVAIAASLALVHRLGSVPDEAAPADPIQAADASAVTVGIVPFESLDADPDRAYLARGLSDNLLTDLSRIAGLRLIRESSAPSRNDTAGPRYRISGSVQRDSDTLRINVHLVDTATHEQLWSQRIQRPFGELLAVQDEITARLVESLPAKLSEVERRRLAQRYTRSVEAYDDFLRARALLLVRRNEENQAARALYEKALEADPQFARAYAGLAMTYALDPRLRDSADPSPALERAFDLARTAQSIDPEIPQVHWALGFVHAQGRRHEQAIQSLQTALALDRSFADGYALLGGIYTYTGQPSRTIALVRTAMRLQPEGGYLHFLLLGRAYLFANDIEQALLNLRTASMRNPLDLETRVYLAAALAAKGDLAGANWEADEVRSLAPAFSARRWLETYPMTSAPQRERLLELLAAASL